MDFDMFRFKRFFLGLFNSICYLFFIVGIAS